MGFLENQNDYVSEEGSEETVSEESEEEEKQEEPRCISLPSIAETLCEVSVRGSCDFGGASQCKQVGEIYESVADVALCIPPSAMDVDFPELKIPNPDARHN